MVYLVLEILSALIVIFITGLLLGWYFRKKIERKYFNSMINRHEEAVLRLNEALLSKNEDLSRKEKNKKRLDEKISHLEKENRSLSKRIEDEEQKVVTVISHLDTCKTNMSGLKDSVKIKDHTIIEGKESLDLLKKEKEALRPEIDQKTKKINQLLEDMTIWENEYQNMEVELTVCRNDFSIKSEKNLNMPEESKDDLKRIKGIGVVLEGMLNQMGINSFIQIASFTEEEINNVSSKLPQFPGRILWDQWVDQAQELHLTKNPDKR